jgi:hypothetical protein
MCTWEALSRTRGLFVTVTFAPATRDRALDVDTHPVSEKMKRTPGLPEINPYGIG